ncbi:succinate dehydrogenase flavoprotein subunit, partial [Bacillus sp. SIMBA_074]
QHGANRLGANSLLSAIYGGMVAGPKAIEYINGLNQSSDDLSSTLFDSFTGKEQAKYDNILKMDGTENAYLIHKELGEWMTDNVTV